MSAQCLVFPSRFAVFEENDEFVVESFAEVATSVVGERVELTWNVYMRALHSREGVSVEFRRLIEKVRAVAVTALESGDGGDVVAGDAHGAWAVDLGERMAFGEDEAAGFSENGVLKIRTVHLDEVVGPSGAERPDLAGDLIQGGVAVTVL